MKKIIFNFVVFTLIIFAIAAANNYVLLELHPLSYYYTIQGMLFTTVVTAIEFPVIWWVCREYFRRVILPVIRG